MEPFTFYLKNDTVKVGQELVREGIQYYDTCSKHLKYYTVDVRWNKCWTMVIKWKRVCDLGRALDVYFF